MDRQQRSEGCRRRTDEMGETGEQNMGVLRGKDDTRHELQKKRSLPKMKGVRVKRGTGDNRTV